MSSKLNIASVEDLALKNAYDNPGLVDAYIQENVDGEGNLTYTISFIQQDAEDASESNVIELDYARASEIAAARDFYEMRVVCTDTSGSGGQLDIISEYGDAALLDLGEEKPVLTRLTEGRYGFVAGGLDLTDAQVMVGAIEGVVLNESSARFQTKTITDDGSNNIVFTAADDLLVLTNVILTVPKSVVDALAE